MPRVPGSTKAPEKCVKTKGQEAGVQRELLFLENVHRGLDMPCYLGYMYIFSLCFELWVEWEGFDSSIL